MVTDTISDFLARMQNVIMRKRESIEIPHTRIVEDIVKILKYENMVEDYSVEDGQISIDLMYDGGEPVVSKFARISKPGRRVYVKAEDIKPIVNGRGIAIISTSSGIMSGALAKSKKLGGEHLCNVW